MENLGFNKIRVIESFLQNGIFKTWRYNEV